MTRIELHRESLELNGRQGPLLRIEDLSSDEITIVNSSFLDLCRNRKVNDIDETYSAYVFTLHTWGIMCPHPQQHRLYDGFKHSDSPIDFESSKWFNCILCSAAVINKLV